MLHFPCYHVFFSLYFKKCLKHSNSSDLELLMHSHIYSRFNKCMKVGHDAHRYGTRL